MSDNLILGHSEFYAYSPVTLGPPMPKGVKPPKDEADEIAHPTHYNTSSIQPIEVVEAWQLGYNLGNVVKYLARHKHKGSPVKDLKKARWYLEREIDILEKGAANDIA